MKLSPEAEAEINRLFLQVGPRMTGFEALRHAMLWAYADAAALCEQEVAALRRSKLDSAATGATGCVNAIRERAK